jgi:hypothetical protein
VQQLPFCIRSHSVAPLCLRAPLLHARAAALAMASLGHPDRFQSEEALNLVRGLLGWSAPGLAGRIHDGAVPLGDLAAEEFVLFTSYISYGLALPISPFFLLLLEEFGLQLQHLTPHSILQAAIFVHLCEMFVGVAPCTSLFRYFFVLVKSGKTRDHIGAYYFQTRPDPAVVYIPTFGGARWENWRNDWVIASTEANDSLILPSDGPALDRKQWRTKPSLSPEFLPILDRIKVLATGGLTSMHVVGDLLKRRIAPLQRRPRLSYWFTGPNDISRIQRRPGTDLSWDELEILVRGITGETFVPESLILLQNVPALCDDPGLRTAILATLPTLDDSGMAVRQTDGRDPLRGIRISGAPVGGPQLAVVAPSANPAVAPSPLDKGKGAASSASAPGSSGGSEDERRRRLRRADGSLVLEPPKSARGLQVGPRRPAPRPTTRRGALVLRSRRHHHHLGVITPRSASGSNSSSSNNSNSNSNRSGGRLASRVTGRSRAPSKYSPFFHESNHCADES